MRGKGNQPKILQQTVRGTVLNPPTPPARWKKMGTANPVFNPEQRVQRVAKESTPLKRKSYGTRS